jgi:hypothetical protein
MVFGTASLEQPSPYLLLSEGRGGERNAAGLHPAGAIGFSYSLQYLRHGSLLAVPDVSANRFELIRPI